MSIREWIGDIIGALCLFLMLFIALWAVPAHPAYEPSSIGLNK